jgi:hypothetical protein
MNNRGLGDPPALDQPARTQCVGCGGRNLDSATVCDWCGRSLVEGRRSWPIGRTVGIAVLLLVILAAVVAQRFVSLTGLSP